MAKLYGTDLSGAELNGANLSGADLSQADLRGAKVTYRQLARAASLEGALLPEGVVQA
jgi:uncharacterized protein YjbI with pentapeptide repeats